MEKQEVEDIDPTEEIKFNTMKSKFTITPEDQKYMDSIGKKLHQPKLVSRAQARTSALRAKIGGGGGKGRSYISGKTYNHA